MNAMVAYGDEWAELHTFLSFAVDKKNCLDLSSTFISSEEVSLFPIIREGGLPNSRFGLYGECRNFMSFLWVEPRSFRPLAHSLVSVSITQSRVYAGECNIPL